MARSLASDLQKLGGLFQKLSNGDVTVKDLLEDAVRDPEEKAEEMRAEKPCRKYHGCTLKDGHKGGCLIDAVVEEVSSGK